MITISPFVFTNGAISQPLVVWPVPLFQASLDNWYIFCSQINQLLPLSTLRKRGIIHPSGHKTRLGFDRKKGTCSIVFSKTLKNSIDIFWLDHDCFAAYNCRNYLRRCTRLVSQRSSCSAGRIAPLVECLTLMLETPVRVPRPLWLCKYQKTSAPRLHRIIFFLSFSPHNRNNTPEQHLF